MLMSEAGSGQLVPSTGFGKKRDSPGTGDVEKKWKRSELLWEPAKKMLIPATSFPNFGS